MLCGFQHTHWYIPRILSVFNVTLISSLLLFPFVVDFTCFWDLQWEAHLIPMQKMIFFICNKNYSWQRTIVLLWVYGLLDANSNIPSLARKLPILCIFWEIMELFFHPITYIRIQSSLHSQLHKGYNSISECTLFQELEYPLLPL